MAKRLVFLTLVLVCVALANNGEPAQWDHGLQWIGGALTGRTAYYVSLICGFLGFAPLAMRGMHIHDFGSTAVSWSMYAGAMLSLPSVLQMFGVTGALI